MKHLLSVLLEATSPFEIGTMGFTFRFGGADGPKALRRCLICNQTFEQDDAGWAALKLHGFERHEQGMKVNWRELHGQTVTIAVVERVETKYLGEPHVDQELMARTDDGVYYLLPRPENYHEAYLNGTYKWKPRSAESNLLRLMQGAQEEPSSG